MRAFNSSILYHVVLVPVIVVILGAFGLSAASIYENIRFVRANAQIMSFVQNVRAFQSAKGATPLAPGEDVWASMVRAGQLSKSTPQANPWHGGFWATAAANASLRIIDEVPARDCRRMGLYIIGLDASEIGLLALEVQPQNDSRWYSIPISTEPGISATIEKACGTLDTARLALWFRIR